MQQFFSPCSAPENKPESFLRHSRKRRARRQASGFTLIEVMVALIIFVGGALAIVRIFPGALAVVQTSETRAIGTRMAQATLARFESQPFTIPEAIYDFDSGLITSQNGFSDFNGAVVGSLSRNASLPLASPTRDDLPVGNQTYSGSRSPISQTALGRFRRIVGEKARVQQFNSSFYVLTRYPYLATGFAAYRDREVSGVRIDNSVNQGQLDFSDATIDGNPIATADPQRPQAAFRAGTYFISYRWSDAPTNGRIQGVVEEPFLLRDDLTWSSGTTGRVLQSFVSSNRIVEGPITVRYREAVTLPVSLTAIDDRARGYVDLGTSGFTVGETISLDYMVADWRWLVADSAPVIDSRVPGNLPRSMAVQSRFFSDEAPFTSTAPVYTLLVGRRSNDPTTPIVRDYGSWDGTAPSGARLLDVDRKTGEVVFDVVDDSVPPTQALIAPRARVVYRNVDGWGHQLSVAAQSYVPYQPNVTGAPPAEHPRQPWREYFHNSNSPGRTLYFHPSEAGKTVMVSFEYEETAGSGVYRNVTNAIVTINDVLTPSSAVSGLPPDFLGSAHVKDSLTLTNNVAVAELSDLKGNLIGTGLASGARVTAITSVRGASIRARTAWFDGNSYSQVAVSGFRPVD